MYILHALVDHWCASQGYICFHEDPYMYLVLTNLLPVLCTTLQRAHPQQEITVAFECPKSLTLSTHAHCAKRFKPKILFC